MQMLKSPKFDVFHSTVHKTKLKSIQRNVMLDSSSRAAGFSRIVTSLNVVQEEKRTETSFGMRTGFLLQNMCWWIDRRREGRANFSRSGTKPDTGRARKSAGAR